MKPAASYLLVATLFACSSEPSSSGSTDADLQAACDNGVTLCKNDPTYGPTFGAQNCSNIAASYMGCDSACRIKAKPTIDCQKTATTCMAFAACR